MKKWWLQGIKYLLLLSFIVPMLAACSVSDPVKEQYPLESVNGSGNQTSYVYRAAGQTVPEVAASLIDQRKPDQQSEQSAERMFLVYPDEIIHLQQAQDNPDDTLIEIDSKEYVRQNYSPSFLEGYLLASLLDDLFDHGRYGGGGYRGYTSKDVYKPAQGTYRVPTDQDKKIAPPMTVEKSGSIFRRSKTADSTAAGSGASSSSSGKSIGKIITNDKKQSSGGSKSSSVFKKPKYSAPKMKMGRGKITRRR